MSDKSIVREITRHMIAEGRLVADPEGRAAYFRLARWIDERYGKGTDGLLLTSLAHSVSYRVRDRDSDYKAMCHEDRDHAELLLRAWLADGRDAVIERRHVFDGGWLADAPGDGIIHKVPAARAALAADREAPDEEEVR